MTTCTDPAAVLPSARATSSSIPSAPAANVCACDATCTRTCAGACAPTRVALRLPPVAVAATGATQTGSEPAFTGPDTGTTCETTADGKGDDVAAGEVGEGEKSRAVPVFARLPMPGTDGEAVLATADEGAPADAAVRTAVTVWVRATVAVPAAGHTGAVA